MFWSAAFIPTLKEAPQEAESTSHKLLLRAGLARMLMSGVYSYLPLGLRVLNNIQNIIRQELNSCGASELLLPVLQPLEIWQRSGRDKDLGEVMVRFADRRGRMVCLGPTHEEVITELVKSCVSSYKQLPLILYQIQTKIRDEIRPRFGLIRACEFIMKDAYSFDIDEQGLDKNYKAICASYKRIFKKCGLNFLTVEADPGVMGGNQSQEFMAPAGDGEDIVLSCPKCAFTKGYSVQEKELGPLGAEVEEKEDCPACATKLNKLNSIEIGHIFKLGAKYSETLGANFLDSKGVLKPIIMGCYGIGVSRLIQAVIEQNNDSDGIIWPKEIAPYKTIVLPLDMDEPKIKKASLDIYKKLEEMGLEVLLDDRKISAGVKFKDADLLGIPLEVIIGRDSIKENNIELKIRRSNKKTIGKIDAVFKLIEEFVNG